MKKWISYALAATFALAPATASAINVQIDNVPLGVEASNINGSTMVPMRAVLEELGAEITWDNTFNTAGINVLGTRLLIRPGEPFMMVNGVVRYLNCPAIEFNGRVMVPIRDVMESIGGKVVWNEAQKLVTVTCAVPETETETTTR